MNTSWVGRGRRLESKSHFYLMPHWGTLGGILRGFVPKTNCLRHSLLNFLRMLHKQMRFARARIVRTRRHTSEKYKFDQLMSLPQFFSSVQNVENNGERGKSNGSSIHYRVFHLAPGDPSCLPVSAPSGPDGQGLARAEVRAVWPRHIRTFPTGVARGVGNGRSRSARLDMETGRGRR